MDNSKKRRALGKGLSSLMALDPSHETEDKKESGVTELPIGLIVTNPFQPRLDFDETSIAELAESIEAQGLIQPIVVREKEKDKLYEIISGERRFRALTKLQRKVIPVIIRTDIDDTKMLEMALVENIQRENLNCIETALSYHRLRYECGLSHEALAKQLGKSRASITNMLRLLKLPEAVQQMVREGKISMGHARALLSLDGKEEEQLTLAKRVESEGLSVRDVEELVKSPVVVDTTNEEVIEEVKEEKVVERDPFLLTLEQRWAEKVGFSVKINHHNEKDRGTIEIPYSNRDELHKLAEIFSVETNES